MNTFRCWTGYPDAPKPEGPFRILEGTEYDEVRIFANKINTNIHTEENGFITLVPLCRLSKTTQKLMVIH